MVLDYDTTLTIALKRISSASTLATFEYEIEQLFTKGEKQALEREAEAIIALATSICLLALIIAAPIILLAGTGKGLVFGWIPLALGELIGAYFLILGMRRLHRSLNPTNPHQLETPSEQTRALSMQERAALPPQPASIVEGTTELMTLQPAPAAVTPVRDTDSME